ncbi:MAG: HupE/UreJ family protein [Bryobacteraceae bacterium]
MRPLFALLVTVAVATGHDMPSDVTVNVFVKPAGNRLQMLVRVPLRAIRDVAFPEIPGGYLDMDKLAPILPDAAAVSLASVGEIREAGARLPQPRVVATQISLPSDRSFASFDEALAHITAPRLATTANVVWNQVLLDVALETPIASDRSEFAVRFGFEHLAGRVITVLRFLPPGGVVRAYEYEGDPGLMPLDPRWSEAARRFVALGFRHILDGTDHLLFLACLVIPFRRLRALVGVVTAFTVAHSITLLASAYDFAPDALWFPPLIETLIAASIVWMAFENIVGASSLGRRWTMAFAFGLVHGFGFSFALRETLQFAGSHLLTSLLAFNVGVELGQILVLMLLIPLLGAVFRWIVAERVGTIILSALVAHTGWHWLTDRAGDLVKYRFVWPALDTAFLVTAMRVTMFVMILGGAVWAVREALARLLGKPGVVDRRVDGS